VRRVCSELLFADKSVFYPSQHVIEGIGQIRKLIFSRTERSVDVIRSAACLNSETGLMARFARNEPPMRDKISVSKIATIAGWCKENNSPSHP
jgi:hypothetical protein